MAALISGLAVVFGLLLILPSLASLTRKDTDV